MASGSRPPATPYYDYDLVPAHPSDELMFKERYIALQHIIAELEDENNVIAYRVAKEQMHIAKSRAGSSTSNGHAAPPAASVSTPSHQPGSRTGNGNGHGHNHGNGGTSYPEYASPPVSREGVEGSSSRPSLAPLRGEKVRAPRGKAERDPFAHERERERERERAREKEAWDLEDRRLVWERREHGARVWEEQDGRRRVSRVEDVWYDGRGGGRSLDVGGDEQINRDKRERAWEREMEGRERMVKRIRVEDGRVDGGWAERERSGTYQREMEANRRREMERTAVMHEREQRHVHSPQSHVRPLADTRDPHDTGPHSHPISPASYTRRPSQPHVLSRPTSSRTVYSQSPQSSQRPLAEPQPHSSHSSRSSRTTLPPLFAHTPATHLSPIHHPPPLHTYVHSSERRPSAPAAPRPPGSGPGGDSSGSGSGSAGGGRGRSESLSKRVAEERERERYSRERERERGYEHDRERGYEGRDSR